MTARLHRGLLLLGLLCVFLAPLSVQAADHSLSDAYAAILRGDYQESHNEIESLLHDTTAGPEAERAKEWLDSYHKVVASRVELKAETFEWNVEQARAALAKDRLTLALSFMAQASAYAADPNAFAQTDWVQEVTRRCLAEAKNWEKPDKWSRALAYYTLLSRIHEHDTQIKDLKEAAARHARVEYAYKDKEALDKRLKDVDEELLRGTVRNIDRMYYKQPDFQRLARGALDNLVTLVDTEKLYSFLDGLANPALREHFLGELSKLREEVDGKQDYGYQDLMWLYKQIAMANRKSIEVPPELLIVEFVEGALSQLDDYTGIIWPADAAEFDKIMMGGFEGVGIQLSLDERTNRLKVVTPLPNSPALEAGVQPDDLIVGVDGQSTKDWSTDDAVQNIMGPDGTEVILTILRPRTGQTHHFKLTRRRINLTTVQGVERLPDKQDTWDYMLDKDAGVAYIRLTNFLPNSGTELLEALETARSQGMHGLVLDVRHNPGGLLDVAVNIVSDFVAQGDVVSTRGRYDDNQERVSGSAPFSELPLVVLVNEGSASASEILAGALQDHDRAIILGDRTFGKGSVQHVRGLDRYNKARLKLTTALYYLPSGRTPHKLPDAKDWGVDPNWKLVLTPKELRRVIEHQRDAFVIHNERTEKADDQGDALSQEERDKILADLSSSNSEDDKDEPFLTEDDIKLLESDPYEAPDTDPQLETALLLVRVKLAAKIPWPADLAAACKTE